MDKRDPHVRKSRRQEITETADLFDRAKPARRRRVPSDQNPVGDRPRQNGSRRLPGWPPAEDTRKERRGGLTQPSDPPRPQPSCSVSTRCGPPRDEAAPPRRPGGGLAELCASSADSSAVCAGGLAFRVRRTEAGRPQPIELMFTMPLSPPTWHQDCFGLARPFSVGSASEALSPGPGDTDRPERAFSGGVFPLPGHGPHKAAARGRAGETARRGLDRRPHSGHRVPTASAAAGDCVRRFKRSAA